MRSPRRHLLQRVAILLVALVGATRVDAQSVTAAGEPAQLDVRAAGERSIRITLKPVGFKDAFPVDPAVVARRYPTPALSLREVARPVHATIGPLSVEVRPHPLTLRVTNHAGALVQEIVFEHDGTLSFRLDEFPVLGMGEGGPLPAEGTPWREQPVQFDRRGRLDTMQPRWQADMYGSRNPVAMLLGTGGWGLFVAAPWGQIDSRKADRGVFIPWKPGDAERVPQNERNQQQALAKGLPPPDAVVPGLFDVFVFDASDPGEGDAGLLGDHRAGGDAAEVGARLHAVAPDARGRRADARHRRYVPREADPARRRDLPGNGLRAARLEHEAAVVRVQPRGLHARSEGGHADLHARHVKVVVHMVPWERDRLPTLHGNIPPGPGETIDESHILTYWQQHEPLVKAGMDAFWPDEGDWFNLHERMRRHQLYYQGHLLTTPNVRPWSLQRNGYPGMAQWGGWVWSGDTGVAWNTLEAQICDRHEHR